MILITIENSNFIVCLNTNLTLKHILIISLFQNIELLLPKFRASAHKLAIETGRYNIIPENDRLCIYCNMGAVENEFHFLLACPKYRDLRLKCFRRYYCNWPTLQKCERLMASNSNSVQTSLAKYIYALMQRRIL